VSLVCLLLEVGDPYAASAQVRHGLEAAPGEARLYCTLGLALLDLAETTAAREAFSRAIELDPGLAEALVNRAIAAYEEGDYDAATSDLTNALETDTANPDLLFNRGIAREAAGLPDEAIADYTLALEDPRADRAALLYQRGRCHAALARPEAARSDLAAHLALGNSTHEQEIRDLLMTCGAPAEQFATKVISQIPRS
jgi:tetratricopeptide (TPR) repeat protein